MESNILPNLYQNLLQESGSKADNFQTTDAIPEEQ